MHAATKLWLLSVRLTPGYYVEVSQDALYSPFLLTSLALSCEYQSILHRAVLGWLITQLQKERKT